MSYVEKLLTIPRPKSYVFVIFFYLSFLLVIMASLVFDSYICFRI